MHKFIYIICFAITFLATNTVKGTVRVVENTADSGAGSLRDAIDGAESGDTVLIDVKGTITLNSEIDINGFGELTIIGPYPKHTTITANTGFSGSIINIIDSGPINIRGLGFVGGNGSVRHITVEECTERVTIEDCLFENNVVTTPDFNGACIYSFNASIRLIDCSIIDNSAAFAAVTVSGASIGLIENCTFSNNTGTTNTGAIRVDNDATLSLFYNTIVYNESSGGAPEAIAVQDNATLIMECNAIGYNGSLRQIQKSATATIISNGGNAVRLNFAGEETDIPTGMTGDFLTSVTLNMGLRPDMKEDGFGLKYWPIVDATSDLINRRAPTGNQREFDCRDAPRILYGPSTALPWPDAGAVEYTHLRVLNNSSLSTTPNSFPWALLIVNQRDAIHYIEFDIAGGYNDMPLTSSAIISDAEYLIDGYSQDESAIPGPHESGFDGYTRAEISINFLNDGGVNNALIFDDGSDGSKIRGVRVHSFENIGIQCIAPNIFIQGSEIGLEVSGSAEGNLQSGIEINGNSTNIGGWEHWMRNVISGNGADDDDFGANIHIVSGEGNRIAGNIIGGAPDGNEAIDAPTQSPNGIFCETSNNYIGTNLVGTGNIIVDNGAGIYFTEGADFNKVLFNSIGVGLEDGAAIGNTNMGIRLEGADNNIIGSTDQKFGNIIAYNGAGITLESGATIATNNTFIGNLIFENSIQGIDIGNDGTVLPNDGGLDPGEQNVGMDFPEITISENCNDTETITTYTVSVPPVSSYRIEFFSVEAGDDNDHGEGDKFLGYEIITPTTNPQTFHYSHGELLPVGTILSATLTQASSGATSEFGLNGQVQEMRNPAFSYSDICPGADATPTISGDTGGEFRFKDAPTDGESINTITGVVSGALEGHTYDIIYGFPGLCLNEDTVSFSVIEVIETFVFNDFCPAASSPFPDPDGPTGSFSWGTPAPTDGATIVAATGVINDPVEGASYPVVQTVTEMGCSQSDTVWVDVISIDETFTFDDICPTFPSDAPVAATAGGSYSFVTDPADGSSINASTGIITGAVEGSTYDVEYEVFDATGVCVETFHVMVDVISTDESFSIDDFCGTLSEAAVVTTAGGEFSFDPLPGDGAAIDVDNGTISMASEGTTYTVIYTVGVCMDSDTIEVLSRPADEAEFTLENHCANIETAAEITGTTGGQFDFFPASGDGAAIDADSGIITGSEGGDYEVRYITAGSGGTCADTVVEMVTLYPIPEITALETDIKVYCPGVELVPMNVEATAITEKVYWHADSQEGELLDSLFSYTPESIEIGENFFFVQPYSDNGCFGEFSQFTLYLSDTAGMQAAEDFDICLGSSAQLEAFGGAEYTWETEVPLGDYNISNPIAFSLTEQVYLVSIKNEDDCEVIDSIQVGFLPKTSCTIDVYNAFSPNDDGTNDYWHIENLINYTPNTVYIYNRWGDELLEIPNYDNITVFWNGSDKNGNDLPPGTYFYVVVSEDVDQNQAGWVQLVR